MCVCLRALPDKCEHGLLLMKDTMIICMNRSWTDGHKIFIGGLSEMDRFTASVRLINRGYLQHNILH